MLRKCLSLTSSSAVVAAILLASMVPAAFCGGSASCPMQTAPEGRAADAGCLPGPVFDCCNGDDAPLSRSSAELLTQQLHGVTSLVLPSPGWIPLPGPSTCLGDSPRGEPAAPPLYTLLATLLL